MTTRKHGYGWRRDALDPRDRRYSVPIIAEVPSSVDLRGGMPPVGDQGQLNSCTAWASTAAWRHELVWQGLPDFEPSELFQYYATRDLEHSTRSDAGATIRDAIKVLAKVGACPEELWPYEPSRFSQRPPRAAYKAAKTHLALSYASVAQSAFSLQHALAVGLVVVFGAAIFASFETDSVSRTGVVPMPDLSSEGLVGWHAMGLVGYDGGSRRYIARNQWGVEWGDGGYATLPYDYVHDARLSSDFWVIRTVE